MGRQWGRRQSACIQMPGGWAPLALRPGCQPQDHSCLSTWRGPSLGESPACCYAWLGARPQRPWLLCPPWGIACCTGCGRSVPWGKALLECPACGRGHQEAHEGDTAACPQESLAGPSCTAGQRLGRVSGQKGGWKAVLAEGGARATGRTSFPRSHLMSQDGGPVLLRSPGPGCQHERELA